MTAEQKELLDWYSSLSNLERLALNYWLLTGDVRLLLPLREVSERLKRYTYMPFFKRPQEASLRRSEGTT